MECGKNSIPDLALLKSNDWAFWGPSHTGDGATGTQQAGGALDKTIPKKEGTMIYAKGAIYDLN